MRKTIISIFGLLLSFGAFAENKADIVKALKSVVVKKGNVLDAHKVLSKADIFFKSQKIDEEVYKEFARIIVSIHKFDQNYYMLDSLSFTIKNNEKELVKAMKKYLPKEDFVIFTDNLQMIKDELKLGNDYGKPDM